MSERKYRHRGYQDSSSEDRPKAPRQGGQDRSRFDGAPRGRGVGAPTEIAFKCAVCGTKIKTFGGIEPGRACDGCGKPLHSCTNCSHFSTAARFECRKPIPQRIESKAADNDCQHYRPKEIRDLRSSSPSSPDDARAAFDALFKK